MDPGPLSDAIRTLDARRIALIKPSALGDVVQTLPLVPALRKRFPTSHIAWVIQEELRDLVDGHPDLDEVITCQRRPTRMGMFRLWRTLGNGRFDTVFDLQGLLRSAVMTLATGARQRIGLETAREGSRYATNLTVPGTDRSVAAHARYWRVAEALGVGDLPRRAWMSVAAKDYRDIRAKLATLPRPIFAVQWGAKWETKRWPWERLSDVLMRALGGFGGSVIIIGGKAERWECTMMQSRIQSRWPHSAVWNLAGETTIKQLAVLMSEVDFAVCNDSGPMHLAAGLGTPTLGIFTCTSPVRSGPPGHQHELVSTEVPCAASYRKTCPHGGDQHLLCHAELSTAKVWTALERLILKNDITRRRQRIAA